MELQPRACWLLARLSDDGTLYTSGLAAGARLRPDLLTAARVELQEQGLIEAGSDPDCRLTDAGSEALQRLTDTGEERLALLLEDWQPEEHPELARMIAVLLASSLPMRAR